MHGEIVELTTNVSDGLTNSFFLVAQKGVQSPSLSATMTMQTTSTSETPISL